MYYKTVLKQCTKNLTLACQKISHLEPDRVSQRPLEVDKILEEPTL